MAQRDASQVQLDFPELTADLIRELRLTGVLGLLNLSDTVVPIISVGNVRPQVIRTDVASYDSAEVFSGFAVGPINGTVIAETGALPAGTFDVVFGGSYTGNNLIANLLELQWRNAANAANLATWPNNAGAAGADGQIFTTVQTALNIGLNERLRWTAIGGFGGNAAGWIMAKLRPTP